VTQKGQVMTPVRLVSNIVKTVVNYKIVCCEAIQSSIPVILVTAWLLVCDSNYFVSQFLSLHLYCKTQNFHMLFISRISRPQQIREK